MTGLWQYREFFPAKVRVRVVCTGTALAMGTAAGIIAVWAQPGHYGYLMKLDRGAALVLCALLLAMVAGAFHFACIMDWQTQTVYHFVWWIAGGAGALFFVLKSGEYVSEIWKICLSWLCFVLLQEWCFVKFYGRADCHAFVVCAMVESGIGMDMTGYLFHMTLAYGILALHQMFCKNIGLWGNLKKPVAFVPYIVISFWIVMIVALTA